MRRFFFAAAAVTLSVGLAVADDTKKSEAAKTEAKQDGEKKRSERLKEIQSEFMKKRNELIREYQAASTDVKPKLVQQINGLAPVYAKKALDLANEDLKDEVALPAAMLSIQLGGRGKTATDAKELLLEHFVDNPKLGASISSLVSDSQLIDRILEKTKSIDVKANVLLAKAETEVDDLDENESEKPIPAGETAAKFQAAARKLEKLAADHGSVNTSSPLGKTIAEAAEKKLFFINNLTIGKKAPDFECELLDGKKAKLSDYKGNVIVLDVWATWCGPCKAMIPHERELVEKMKSKPFKLVSLSADEKKETLTKFLETEEMPWTHMWSGGATGNFLEQYQIRYYPTIYVLDAKGVIRFKHVRGEKMNHAVETLLKELSGASE